MTKYRDNLPQTNGRDMAYALGMGTWLPFKEGFEAPNFATFLWLDDPKALNALQRSDDRRLKSQAHDPHNKSMLVAQKQRWSKGNREIK